MLSNDIVLRDLGGSSPFYRRYREDGGRRDGFVCYLSLTVVRFSVRLCIVTQLLLSVNTTCLFVR